MSAFWTTRSNYTVMNAYFAGLTTLKLMYLKAGYVPNVEINVVSDIVANECDVTGYSRQTVTGVTVVESDSLDRASLRADNPPDLTLGVGNDLRHVALIVDTGSDATSIVHLVMDMGSTHTTDGNAFPVSLSPSGMGRYQN